MQNLSLSKIDKYYMDIAISLAKRGTGAVSPNPRVGCVIAKNNKMLSYGWHEKFGCAHAEVNAVKKLSDAELEGSTVYVTLEPCSHYGKTPPCAELLKSKKVARVVIATVDPNPLVDNKGIKILEKAGIQTDIGICEKDARYLNRGFIKRILHNKPWVTLKTAASLDGNIALLNGESKWITSSVSRHDVHSLRAENDGILTGIGTVLVDNPTFTVRDSDGKSPKLYILDRHLKSSANSNIFNNGNRKICIFTIDDEHNRQKSKKLLKKNLQIVRIRESGYNLSNILSLIAEQGLNYLMVECGPTLTSLFLQENEVDEFYLYVGGKILGSGQQFSRHLNFDSMSDTLNVNINNIRQNGDDFTLKGVITCLQD